MRIFTATALIIGCTLVACSSQDKPVPSIPSTSSPRDVAKYIYDGLDSGEDVQARLHSAFEWAGIPVKSEAELQLDSKTPVVYEPQLEWIGNGYQSGIMLTLDSWAKQLSADGYLSASGQAFSLEEVTAALEPLVDFESQPPGTKQRTLALALALGRERASRSQSGVEDSVWGDRVLDPLQFQLLALAMQEAFLEEGANAERKDSFVIQRSAQGWDDLVTDWVKEGVKDADPRRMTRVQLCIASRIFNMKVVTRASVAPVYHRQESEQPPYSTTLAVSAQYEWRVTPGVDAFLRALNCPAPTKGKYSGLDVRWYPDSIADAHGGLSSEQYKTDAATGTATAIYQTILESTWPQERTEANLKSENAGFEVYLSGALPDAPLVEFVMANGPLGIWAQMSTTLSVAVRYYRPPRRDVCSPDVSGGYSACNYELAAIDGHSLESSSSALGISAGVLSVSSALADGPVEYILTFYYRDEETGENIPYGGGNGHITVTQYSDKVAFSCSDPDGNEYSCPGFIDAYSATITNFYVLGTPMTLEFGRRAKEVTP